LTDYCQHKITYRFASGKGEGGKGLPPSAKLFAITGRFQDVSCVKLDLDAITLRIICLILGILLSLLLLYSMFLTGSSSPAPAAPKTDPANLQRWKEAQSWPR
jgi:hypothetical protein